MDSKIEASKIKSSKELLLEQFKTNSLENNIINKMISGFYLTKKLNIEEIKEYSGIKNKEYI
jgi:hypothetical protein